MLPETTDKTNVTFELKGGTRENDLPIFRRSSGATTLLSSYWRPSAEELVALEDGGLVELTVWSNQHPPVGVSVADNGYEPDIPEGAQPETERKVGGAVVVLDGRAWPLLEGETYAFTGAQLAELLLQAAGAASGVFLQEDPQKAMPSEQVTLAVHAWAVETTPEWGKAHDRAAGS